jgi:hypothetical protein
MKPVCVLILTLTASLAGCQHVRTSQKAGTEYVTDSDGHTRAVTYVTPDAYDKMTPEERRRLNATVGAEVSLPLFGGKQEKKRDLTEEELRDALGK